MHCAQVHPAEPQRMRRARMENKETGKGRQHTERRKRNPERSKKARIKNVPKAQLMTEEVHPQGRQSL